MLWNEDNVGLYEKDTLWSVRYLELPYYREKVRLVKGMIPEYVRTVLDVGCGNGAIANELKSEYQIFGGDRSLGALQYLQVPSIQLSAGWLPFKDHAFDLVMSHQLLEHLSERVYVRAVRELRRVAKRYLLVSVPYRDRLAQQLACCAHCRCKYNVWGHLRSFAHVSQLREVFSGFELRVHAFCGQENEYMSRPLLWLCQWVGGVWAIDPKGVCPRCGSSEQYEARLPQRGIAAIAQRVDRLIPKKKAFWWLLCLFERKESVVNRNKARALNFP